MGKVRKLVESVAIMGLWCAITTVTGCSADEVVQSCRGAAEVMETCEIQPPEFMNLEKLPEGFALLWQEIAARG